MFPSLAHRQFMKWPKVSIVHPTDFFIKKQPHLLKIEKAYIYFQSLNRGIDVRSSI